MTWRHFVAIVTMTAMFPRTARGTDRSQRRQGETGAVLLTPMPGRRGRTSGDTQEPFGDEGFRHSESLSRSRGMGHQLRIEPPRQPAGGFRLSPDPDA